MNPTVPQHSHKQLYIIIGLLVIFAILFFTFKTSEAPTLPTTVQQNSTPLGLKQIVLTAEQIAAKTATFNDPGLTKAAPLTKTQQQQKAATLSDPKMTEATAMTDAQIRAKEASFNQ